MKYESPYQPWRADESWSLTLVGVLASHRFGSLQKPEKRHTTSRIFGLLDTGYIPVLPKSNGSYFPMFMGWGKLAAFYHWKNQGKNTTRCRWDVPKCGNVLLFTMVSFRGCLILGGTEYIWLYGYTMYIYIYCGYIWWNSLSYEYPESEVSIRFS